MTHVNFLVHRPLVSETQTDRQDKFDRNFHCPSKLPFFYLVVIQVQRTNVTFWLIVYQVSICANNVIPKPLIVLGKCTMHWERGLDIYYITNILQFNNIHLSYIKHSIITKVCFKLNWLCLSKLLHIFSYFGIRLGLRQIKHEGETLALNSFRDALNNERSTLRNKS